MNTDVVRSPPSAAGKERTPLEAEMLGVQPAAGESTQLLGAL